MVLQTIALPLGDRALDKAGCQFSVLVLSQTKIDTFLSLVPTHKHHCVQGTAAGRKKLSVLSDQLKKKQLKVHRTE